MSNASTHERIHALDSLRAIMMILGLVIHTAITYGVVDYGRSWSLKDAESTSLSMDWIVSFIHVFRMPLFFVVAGFFAALLFYKRGAKKMIKNRLDRILYPFLVFVFILWPTIVFSFAYSKAVFAGSENPLEIALSSFQDLTVFVPGRTFHLWFLYYLLMITIVSFAIGLLLKKTPKFSKNILRVFDPIVQYPFLKLFVFSALTFLMLYIMNDKWVATSTSFIPDFKTFTFYSFFYIFGWILYKSKQPLEQLKQYDWVFTILGLGLFTIKFFFSSSLGDELTMAINSILVWLFSFGITGLFIRYGSNHSHLMRYVSDSSYWLYLLHLPLTAIIPGLIAEWKIPALGKFLIVLSLTSLICWFTYHYFVRATFIGKFLNGRRYAKSINLQNLPERKVQTS